MKQVARNLTDDDGVLQNTIHLLLDRDTKFLPLREFLKSSEHIHPVVLPPHSPNCNAHLERFMLSLKSEGLDRMIFLGEAPLRKALAEFKSHYHKERNHPGLDKQLVDPDCSVVNTTGNIECRERLGGLLRYYFRKAA